MKYTQKYNNRKYDNQYQSRNRKLKRDRRQSSSLSSKQSVSSRSCSYSPRKKFSKNFRSDYDSHNRNNKPNRNYNKNHNKRYNNKEYNNKKYNNKQRDRKSSSISESSSSSDSSKQSKESKKSQNSSISLPSHLKSLESDRSIGRKKRKNKRQNKYYRDTSKDDKLKNYKRNFAPVYQGLLKRLRPYQTKVILEWFLMGDQSTYYGESRSQLYVIDQITKKSKGLTKEDLKNIVRDYIIDNCLNDLNNQQPVLDIDINYEQKFAIVEFSSVEESNRLLKLNHIDILKIRCNIFRLGDSMYGEENTMKSKIQKAQVIQKGYGQSIWLRSISYGRCYGSYEQYSQQKIKL